MLEPGIGKTCMRAKVFFDTNVLVYAAVGTGNDEHIGSGVAGV
jgi:hypothetical protein